MLYFSPLSVTDDKQRDRNHPLPSSYSAGRAMILFKVAGYFLYYILTGLFDERWIFCGCVAVIGLGDLVTWRHFVRGLEGAAQLFIMRVKM